jgi:hypothetical protein
VNSIKTIKLTTIIRKLANSMTKIIFSVFVFLAKHIGLIIVLDREKRSRKRDAGSKMQRAKSRK